MATVSEKRAALAAARWGLSTRRPRETVTLAGAPQFRWLIESFDDIGPVAFISPDPEPAQPGLTDSSYAYAANDPALYIDADGLRRYRCPRRRVPSMRRRSASTASCCLRDRWWPMRLSIPSSCSTWPCSGRFSLERVNQGVSSWIPPGTRAPITGTTLRRVWDRSQNFFDWFRPHPHMGQNFPAFSTGWE